MHRPRLVVVLVADHDVEVLEPQRGHALLDLQLAGLDADAGVGRRQLAHRRRDDAQERRLERRDADHPGDLAGGDLGDLGLGRLDGVEQGLRVADQDPAGLGQPDVATDPLEQGRAGLALEHGELLGHGARRVAERLGRGAHRVPGLELAEQPEPVQVEHPLSISSRSRPDTRDRRERSRRPGWTHGRHLLLAVGHRLRRDGDLRQARVRRGRHGRRPAAGALRRRGGRDARHRLVAWRLRRASAPDRRRGLRHGGGRLRGAVGVVLRGARPDRRLAADAAPLRLPGPGDGGRGGAQEGVVVEAPGGRAGAGAGRDPAGAARRRHRSVRLARRGPRA